jgi:hypothetical protein
MNINNKGYQILQGRFNNQDTYIKSTALEPTLGLMFLANFIVFYVHKIYRFTTNSGANVSCQFYCILVHKTYRFTTNSGANVSCQFYCILRT